MGLRKRINSKSKEPSSPKEYYRERKYAPSELDVLTTGVYNKICLSDKRYLALQGGSRSSKTYSILQFCIFLALNNPKDSLQFLHLRAKLVWTRQTLLEDFKAILNSLGMYSDKCFNKSEMYYQLGNSRFSFGGLDVDGSKFHGRKTDYVHFNEANELDWRSVDQLLLRLTGRAFFDFNPSFHKGHWLQTKIIKDTSRTEFIKSTYKDNYFLSDNEIDNIERYAPTAKNIAMGTANEQMHKIYALGERATLTGLIYPTFNYIKEFPKLADLDEWLYAVDWGWNDPCTLILCGIKGFKFYAKELYCGNHTHNLHNAEKPDEPSLEKIWHRLEVDKRQLIIADCSEPKSISDMCNLGYNVKKVDKSGGKYGMILNFKQYSLNITEDSLNIKKEIETYKWMVNKWGETLDKPMDGNDHCLDAMLYASSLYSANPNFNTSKSVRIENMTMNTGAEKYDY